MCVQIAHLSGYVCRQEAGVFFQSLFYLMFLIESLWGNVELVPARMWSVSSWDHPVSGVTGMYFYGQLLHGFWELNTGS